MAESVDIIMVPSRDTSSVVSVKISDTGTGLDMLATVMVDNRIIATRRLELDRFYGLIRTHNRGELEVFGRAVQKK